MVRGLPRVSARSEKALRADQALPRRYRVIVDISQRPRTFGASRGRTARALHLGGLSSPPRPRRRPRIWYQSFADCLTARAGEGLCLLDDAGSQLHCVTGATSVAPEPPA